MRRIVLAATVLLAGAGSAAAASGAATGNVNLRTGPGAGYARIATIPAGARVNVIRCARWCEVVYAGRRGWAAASYIARPGMAPRRSAYPVLPDKSLCHGPQSWSIPYCETPLERSVRDFERSTWEFNQRQRNSRR